MRHAHTQKSKSEEREPHMQHLVARQVHQVQQGQYKAFRRRTRRS